MIVSDIDTIQIHTNFTNTAKRVYPLTLDDLLKPEGLETLRLAFFDPEKLKIPETREDVTKEVAAHFAKLAESLRKYGEQPAEIAHFLIQLLFCLFAEDAGLLPNNLFTRLLNNARFSTGAFTAQLTQLFDAMCSGGWFGSDRISHFDGRLFENNRVLELDSDGLRVLAQVAALNWSNIEPSIFGTLFERSLDPSKRSQLGAHYTSKDDILLIVEPVLMAPLRRRWRDVQSMAQVLAEKRDEQKGPAKKASVRKKLNDQLAALLTGFASEIASVQVLDPACGSGNFLYVALRQLLDLEKEVITQAAVLGVGSFFPSVNPAQLHGIEVNPYAHQLAQATIWIGYLQWMRDNGYGYSEPILKPLDNILLMDAILAYEADGKPVEPEWPKADVIIGNPPFLGDKKMRAELGDNYVDAIRIVYKDRLPGQSDLVCYWFEIARWMIEQGKSERAGFLSTNAIRKGSNRTVLEEIRKSGNLFMAWSDRQWILNGATVRVSMVGFSGKNEDPKILDGKPVVEIYPDLTSHSDVSKIAVLVENQGLYSLGIMKAGPFDLNWSAAQEMISSPKNPNGRPNSDVVKPRIGGQDITGRSRNGWIIDFNNLDIEQAAMYEKPFEYARRVIKPLRDNNRNSTMRNKWWLHGRSRPELRKAFSKITRCIVTPEVAKHRIFTWISTGIIPDHQLIVFFRDDDYFIGLLHSKAHEIWARSTGSQLREAESGFRYTPTTTFETFPLPWPPGKEPQDDPRVQAIAAAARDLVAQRDAWLNPPGLPEAELQKRTLTNLYNQRPAWLDLAHKQLDAAVFAAYGWPADLSDEQILERLLAMNIERSFFQSAGG